MKKAGFFFLQATWGVFMNVLGVLAFLVCLLTGRPGRRFGNAVAVPVGRNWGGVSLGVFLFTGENPTRRLLIHEYGHSVQNALFGPLFPFLIGIPSAVRYWIRASRARRGKEEKTAYEAVWFERQATRLGQKFMPPDVIAGRREI